MKKLYFLILIGVSVIFKVSAQAPLSALLSDGNSWKSTHGYTDIRNNIIDESETFKVTEKDTVIYGKTFSIVYKKTEKLVYVSNSSNEMIQSETLEKMYFREGGDSLLHYDLGKNLEITDSYFTGTEVGDTIVFFLQDLSYGIKEVITKVETKLFAETSRRIFWTKQKMAYVDGIGFTGGGLRAVTGFWFEESIQLNCAFIDNIPFVGVETNDLGIEIILSPDPLDTECSIIEGIQQSSSAFSCTEKISSEGNIILTSTYKEPVTVKLFNVSGFETSKSTGVNEITIDTSELQSGLYILTVEVNGDVKYRSKVIAGY